MSEVERKEGLEDITTTAAVISSALETAAATDEDEFCVPLVRQEYLETSQEHKLLNNNLVSNTTAPLEDVDSARCEELECIGDSDPCQNRGGNPPDGNHVGGISPLCPSPSMAERNFTGSGRSGRDKSNNLETHEGRHCSEKSATYFERENGVEEVPIPPTHSRVFQPSSKIIELPEKSSRDPSHSHFRSKESKIPVGIAVAWQRLVTTTSTPGTGAPAMTTKAESAGGNGPPNLNTSDNNKSGKEGVKPPSRPSSASPHSHKVGKTLKQHHTSSNNDNYANLRNTSSLIDIRGASYRGAREIGERPGSVCSEVPFCPSSPSPLSRPLPSSSVPPNMGYPASPNYHYTHPHQQHHHRSPYLDYYGITGNGIPTSTSFAVPSPIHSPHHQSHHLVGNGHYWGGSGLENPCVPLLSPGAPGDYMQLSMQQQIHLHQQHYLASRSPSLALSSSAHYNPYLSFLPQESGLAQKNPYYEHHHYQNELLRQSHSVSQQSASPLSRHGVNGGFLSGEESGPESGPVNGAINKRSSSRSMRSVGGFDLLANKRDEEASGRVLPIQVAIRRESIPLLSPSPTGGIRTPTPTSQSSSSSTSAVSAATTTAVAMSSPTRSQLQQEMKSQFGGGIGGESVIALSSCSSASSPSPSFLQHQQHPHLFTSSAALSPKSLTSSTPSPVTVHDFNSGLNVVIGSGSGGSGGAGEKNQISNMLASRKCTTPSPISLPSRGLLSPFGSPFSPSPLPTHPSNNNNNNGNFKVWREDGGKKEENGEGLSPLLKKKQFEVPTPLSSPSQKHDFKRLESLIERRDRESISPLVLIPQTSPASTTSSSGEKSLHVVKMEEDEVERKVVAFCVKVEQNLEENSCSKSSLHEESSLMEKRERVKVEVESPPEISFDEGNDVHSCDDAVCNHGGGNDAVENGSRNKVPESTLPSDNDKYYTNSFKESPPTHHQNAKKDVSFTSGYSSSHDGCIDEVNLKLSLVKVKKGKEKKAKVSLPVKPKALKEKKVKKIAKEPKEKRIKKEKEASKSKSGKKTAPFFMDGAEEPVKKKRKKKGDNHDEHVEHEEKKRKRKEKVFIDKTAGEGGKRKKKEKKNDRVDIFGGKGITPVTKMGPSETTDCRGDGDTVYTSFIRKVAAPSCGESNGDQNSSLISPMSPPMQVFLHGKQPSTVSCPSQVTFLIASPPPPDVGTIRIPAYIPRSSQEHSMTDNFHFGGEDISGVGPATLTLHRDEMQHIGQGHSRYFQQQPPPAITIQYHHSAPATPSMECGSPQYSYKPEESPLNLLATVAQEFGSREDLGKRLSIDGSCNSSLIGESPPMSPQKYSAFVPQPQQLQQKKYLSFESAWAPPVKATESLKDLLSVVMVKEKVENVFLSGLPVKAGKKQKSSKEKTTNSIRKPKKAGKKEKRSISDCASYSPSVVLLKIPQISPKRALSLEKGKKERRKKGEEKVKGEKRRKSREEKSEKKSPTGGEPGSKRGKKDCERSSSGKKLKLKIPFPEGDPFTLGKSISPDKGEKSQVGGNPLVNPSERISAFAKQVFARKGNSGSSKMGEEDKETFTEESTEENVKTEGESEEMASMSPPFEMPLLTPYDEEPEEREEHSSEVPKEEEAKEKDEDRKKTEFIFDRSRNGEGKQRKDGEKKKRKNKDVPKPLTLMPEKKKKKDRHVSLNEGIKKKRKRREERSQSFPERKLEEEGVNVPRITINSPGGRVAVPEKSLFSPLTPPPTAKSSVEEEDEGRKKIFSNLLVSTSEASSPARNSGEGECETENENDFTNWVADPMHAVSAIKISPADIPPSGDDIGDFEKEKVGEKETPEETTLIDVVKEIAEEDEHVPFLQVKTDLKSFIHFKPKQLAGNKGQSPRHHIKPCLKADPIVRSQDEDDGEEDEGSVDDEDFILDLEVANICAMKRKKGSGPGPAPSPATSSSSAGKKPSINRNSLSYLSTSSSGKKHPSTKEIMSKVFSRKVSPDLGGGGLSGDKNKKRRRSSGNGKRKQNTTKVSTSQIGTEMDADDEEDEEDELLDVDGGRCKPIVSMTAAAAAVVVNVKEKKTPKKRSARSSTTSSCASSATLDRGQRSSRSNRGLLFGGQSSSDVRQDETNIPGKVPLDGVDELVDEMRILTEIQGLFYTGRLNALQPPDVYGVTLDNERGAPPHIIFSAEEVLEKCLREKKPLSLTSGLRICAYWSPQYSGLYPGRVSSDFNPKFDPEKDLIPIEFDDGDTGMIKLNEIRLLSTNHPVREYDPNPLQTLEKKQRKRRHSSATGTSGGCTGDHDEEDCGEPYCAKVGKLEEEDEDEEEGEDEGNYSSSSKMLYWTWSGLGYKRAKNKKNRNKEFFHGVQRGEEAINVGDAALFISTGNERPFIGRVERFWESKGKKMVNVRWFYHPEEVKASAKRLSNLKYPGALFESPHIDENDVQTIAKKCDVLPFADFKQRMCAGSAGSPRLAKLSMKSTSKPRDMYYVAGYYDPYTYNLTLKDLK